jgi:hypothetical protein
MSKLTKLIQEHTGGAESLENILKEALLLDRKCQNLELALQLASNCNNVYYNSHPERYPAHDSDYWLEQAMRQINEQNKTS